MHDDAEMQSKCTADLMQHSTYRQAVPFKSATQMEVAQQQERLLTIWQQLKTDFTASKGKPALLGRDRKPGN